MSLPDTTASAALGGMVIKPVHLVWLDIDGAVLRANDSGRDITPSGTGVAELDGHTFTGISASFVDLSAVGYSAGGSKSVTATLSGIPGLDDATLALIDDPTAWQGRDAIVWQIIRNAANVQQGGYRQWAGGWIESLSHGGAPGEGLTISVTIEGYLASLSQASNRSYLDQERYDAGDLSAQAAIAIANGNFTNAIVPTTYNNGPDPYGYNLPFGNWP